MTLPANMGAQSPIYRKFRNYFLRALEFLGLYLQDHGRLRTSRWGGAEFRIEMPVERQEVQV